MVAHPLRDLRSRHARVLAQHPRAVAVIDGPCGRKTNNALTMSFLRNGAGEPIATALQSGGDGMSKKLGILLGFKNGSEGMHVVTYADGTTLAVPVVGREPTHVTRGDGSAVCTITREATTTITAPDGATLLVFSAVLVDPRAGAHYRLRVDDGAGVQVALLDVVRVSGSYDDLGVVDVLEAVDFVAGVSSAVPAGRCRFRSSAPGPPCSGSSPRSSRTHSSRPGSDDFAAVPIAVPVPVTAAGKWG